MKTPEEKRVDWLFYVASLPWIKGQLDEASWNTFLRAASCGVKRDDALAEVENRIRAAGGAVKVPKLQSQCRRAWDHVGMVPAEGSTWRPRPAFDQRAKPGFDEARLKAFAEEWAPHTDVVWLGNRSHVDPATVTAGEFLSYLYCEGEMVMLFSVFRSQGQMLWGKDLEGGWSVRGADLGQDYTANFVEVLSGPDGVWFLSQPIDGQEHVNPRQQSMSRRSEESVTGWRYLVLESDTARPRDWLGALVQLPLRIAAIYTSGGKSVHALIRVDAASKAHWDAERDALRDILVTMGGDPAAMTAVRLTRLPGCRRGDRLQKLLYLDPNPSGLRPICARAPKRDVVAEWGRYADALIEARADPDELGDNAWGNRVDGALDHYAPVSVVLAAKLQQLRGTTI